MPAFPTFTSTTTPCEGMEDMPASPTFTSRPCAGKEEILAGVCVKNTFIDVVVAPAVIPSRRLGNSVPPSLRLARGDKAPAPEDIDGKEAHAAPWTEEEDAAADVSTDAGTSTNDAESQADLESVLTLATLSSAHSGGQAFRVSTPSTNSTCEESPFSSCGRARLNTRARAWAPAAPCAVVLDTPEVRYFKQEMHKFIAAAKAALVSCLYITGVQVTEDGAKGMSMVIRINSDCVQYSESTLSLVKQALLESATTSQQVVLLGYGARPFIPMPAGFSAIFCLVPNKQVACWGLLKQGVCRYGAQCRWQHPVCQGAIHVKILFEEPTCALPPPQPRQ